LFTTSTLIHKIIVATDPLVQAIFKFSSLFSFNNGGI